MRGTRQAKMLKSATRRALGTACAVALLLSVVLPEVAPERARAAAMTLADGVSVAGDFRGNGRAQIASLYDPNDDLGLRIVLLERSGQTDAFAHEQWLVSGANSFDLARMKVAATDVDLDGKTDLVALYDDGATSVRLLVFRSTGSAFVYAGSWWQSDGYAWSRTNAVLSGSFSAGGRSGLLLVYQYDDFQMRIHYLESDGARFLYGGNAGVYDSGPGQYDTARAKFVVGRFTRTSGPDQIASIYQYPGSRVRTHVFDPSPAGLVPMNGWGGVYDSGEGMFDTGRMKIAAGDVDGDGRTDIASLYRYPDGSSRVHFFSGAAGLALAGPGVAGIASLSPEALAWPRAQVLAGDWNGDRAADLATLESRGDGTTRAGTLTATGARTATPTLAFRADAWVTPASEVQRSACAEECWPLTGLPHRGGPVGRRGLLVKIDNSPQARPHFGISEADIVFETLVEGNITRLAVVLHSKDPATLGSIRSGRISDRYLTPMIRGGLVYSGATIEETEMFRNDAAAGGYFDLSAAYWGGYYRVGTRVSPYNQFTSSDAQRQNLNDAGGGAAVAIPRWDFLRDPQHSVLAGGFAGSVGGSELTIPYRSRSTVRYVFEPRDRTYTRWQDNGAGVMVREVDAANRVAVAPRNVVIIWTEHWETNIVEDILGSKGLDMNLVGEGPASIFRGGRRQDGIWTRPTIDDPFRFWTRDGALIYLSPGQTWFHPLPHGWIVPSS